MTKDLIIVGTGLFAEVARAYFEEYTSYKVKQFACHAQYRKVDTIYGCSLVTIEELGNDLSSYIFFIAVGYGKMNSMRESIFNELKLKGAIFVNFIHPDVKVWDSTKLGENIFIFEDNTIQPFTEIGSNSVLWSGNHLGHHSKIGEHSFISSHVVISGSCKIGSNVFIGVNATLRDGITVGDRALIGAGALIMRDVGESEVYIASATKKFLKTSNQLDF